MQRKNGQTRTANETSIYVRKLRQLTSLRQRISPQRQSESQETHLAKKNAAEISPSTGGLELPEQDREVGSKRPTVALFALQHRPAVLRRSTARAAAPRTL